MTGGLRPGEKTSYMIIYAFYTCRLPPDFYDAWSLKDLNGYLAFFRNRRDSDKRKTKPGKVFTERNLDELLGRRQP